MMETKQIETNKRRQYAEWEGRQMDSDIVESFINLLELFPVYEINTSESKRLNFYDVGISWDRYTIEKKYADAMLLLGENIKKGLKLMYEKGKSDGKDLLMQLNNNDISATDFIKK